MPTQADTILHTGDGGTAGAPLSASDALANDGDGGLVALANDAVLALHDQLEAAADGNGSPGTIHGLTNLGETAGLGKIGDPNLVTTALDAPSDLAAGHTSSVGQATSDAGPIGGAAAGLAEGALGDAGVDPGLVTQAAGALPAAEALGAAPETTFSNDVVRNAHATLEGAADAGGLAGTVHGITTLGETAGLGKIGDPNLVTDAMNTPSALLAGDPSTLTHLPTDAGAIVTAAQGELSGVASDVASGAFLADPIGHTVGLASVLPTLPAEGLANEGFGSVHATLEAATETLAPDTVHGVVGLGNSVGLGAIGGANALTDALDAPGALLAGDTTPVSHLPADVGTIGSAVAGLPGDVAGDLGQSGLVQAVTHPTTGGGILGGDLPGAGVAATVESAATSLVDGAANAAGIGGVGTAVTNAVEGAQTGAVHDVAHVPGDVLGGVEAGASPLPGDAGSGLGSVGSIVGSVSDAASHALAAADLGGAAGPVVGAIAEPVGAATHLAGSAVETALSAGSSLTAPVTSGLGGDPAHGLSSALDGVTHLAGGAAGALGSTVSGLASSIGGSGTGGGSSAAQVSVGPEASKSAFSLDILSSGGNEAPHVVDVHAGSAGAPAPTIANVAVLPDSISVPPAAGGGFDALHGIASAGSPLTAPVASAAVASAHFDVGVAHVDLPIAAAHAEPLAGLAHAV